MWDDEPAGKHTIGCAVWTTHDDPCDCGAGDVYLRPEDGSTAARLDALVPVELDCDEDVAS